MRNQQVFWPGPPGPLRKCWQSQWLRRTTRWTSPWTKWTALTVRLLFLVGRAIPGESSCGKSERIAELAPGSVEVADLEAARTGLLNHWFRCVVIDALGFIDRV